MSDNKEDFIGLYEQLRRKKPSSASPWVNNDFLIFVLIVGIYRYSIDKEWIKNVLSQRHTCDDVQNKINSTLKNILVDNYNSTENLLEIVIVHNKLSNKELQIQPKHTQSLYQKITNDTNLFSGKHSFLTCISMRAIELLIENCEISNYQDISNLRAFKRVFIKRVEIISKVICFILLSIITFLIISSVLKHYETWGKIGLIIGLISNGGLFVCWSLLNKIIRKCLLSLFGYAFLFTYNTDS